MKYLATTAIILLVIIIPLLIYTSNVSYMNKHNNQEELNKNVVHFLHGNEELSKEFTENEVSHMQDVKNLIIIGKIIIALSALTIFFTKKQDLKKAMFLSGIIILIFALLLILSSFNNTFTIFHKILFPQGNWAFPINSTLIQLYSTKFFMQTTTKIITIITSLGILLTATKLFSNNQSAS